MTALPRFDLRLLRAAVAVRDAGSVTAAARRLRTSQPAVSRLLRTLEDQLGLPLFERAQRQLRPAPRALPFLDRAATLLVEAGRLGTLAAALGSGQRAAIRIVAVPNIALGALQGALRHFARAHPEIEVQVAVRFRPDLLRELESGQADFGLTVLPVGNTGLRVRPFHEARAICLLPARHRAARRRVVTPSDLHGADLAVLPDGAILQTWVDDAFTAAGATYRRRFTVDTSFMAAQLAADGLCCAVTHPIAPLTLPAGVVQRPFEPAIRLTYALLERVGAELGAMGGALEKSLHRASAAGIAGARGRT